jgi:hypothetical protein
MPMRSAGVDFHRLAGDPLALVRVADEMQRPHVMEPVRQLDEQYANVAAHGQHQLAKILRLFSAVRL